MDRVEDVFTGRQLDSQIGRVLNPTANRSNSTSSTQPVNDRSVCLNCSIHREVTSIACVRDIVVFKNSDSGFDGIDGSASILQECHGRSRSFFARFQMNPLILDAVVASACMDEDGTKITTSAFASEVCFSWLPVHRTIHYFRCGVFIEIW